MDVLEQVLFDTERFSERERDLPAHVMVCHVISLALYANVSTHEVLRCLTEGARWLGDPTATTMPSKSGISQARTRLGAAPRWMSATQWRTRAPSGGRRVRAA